MNTSSHILDSFPLEGLKGIQLDAEQRVVRTWRHPKALESLNGADSLALRVDHDALRFFEHAYLLPVHQANRNAQTKRRRRPSEEMIPPWQSPEKPHPLWGQMPLSMLLGDFDEVAMNVINQRGPRLNNSTHKPPPLQPRIFFCWLQSPGALRGEPARLEPQHFDFSVYSADDRSRCPRFSRAGLLQGLTALLIEDAKIALGPFRPAHFYARRESVHHHAMVWAGDSDHYYKHSAHHPYSSRVREMPGEVSGLLFRRLPALPYGGNDAPGCSPANSRGNFPPTDPQWWCLVVADKDLHAVPSRRFNALVVLNSDGTLVLRDSNGRICPVGSDVSINAPYAALRTRLMMELLADLRRFFS